MNARLNLDRFKAARLPRAKGFAETSTLLRELLERTRAASTLSDLPRPWTRIPSGASRFAERPASTDGAQFLAKTYANTAGSRPYKVYVPSCYDGKPLPLIVMLHGCTQSPDDFAA